MAILEGFVQFGGENVAQAPGAITDQPEVASDASVEQEKHRAGPSKDLSPNERRAIRGSLLIPFFISLALWLIHVAVLLSIDISALKTVQAETAQTETVQEETVQTETEQEETVQDVIVADLHIAVDLFIGYFSVSIISTTLVMLLQEYYFRTTSWLIEERVLLLMGILFVYIVFFVLYLVPITGRTFKWVLFACTFPTIVCLWKSLRIDIRHIEAEERFLSGNDP